MFQRQSWTVLPSSLFLTPAISSPCHRDLPLPVQQNIGGRVAPGVVIPWFEFERSIFAILSILFFPSHWHRRAWRQTTLSETKQQCVLYSLSASRSAVIDVHKLTVSWKAQAEREKHKNSVTCYGWHRQRLCIGIDIFFPGLSMIWHKTGKRRWRGWGRSYANYLRRCVCRVPSSRITKNTQICPVVTTLWWLRIAIKYICYPSTWHEIYLIGYFCNFQHPILP